MPQTNQDSAAGLQFDPSGLNECVCVHVCGVLLLCVCEVCVTPSRAKEINALIFIIIVVITAE